jgi:hypothetical protein
MYRRMLIYFFALLVGTFVSPIVVFTFLNWGNKSIECWSQVRKPFIQGYTLLYLPIPKEAEERRAKCMGLTVEADRLVRRWDISAPYPFVD